MLKKHGRQGNEEDKETRKTRKRGRHGVTYPAVQVSDEHYAGRQGNEEDKENEEYTVFQSFLVYQKQLYAAAVSQQQQLSGAPAASVRRSLADHQAAQVQPAQKLAHAAALASQQQLQKQQDARRSRGSGSTARARRARFGITRA